MQSFVEGEQYNSRLGAIVQVNRIVPLNWSCGQRFIRLTFNFELSDLFDLPNYVMHIDQLRSICTFKGHSNCHYHYGPTNNVEDN